MHKMQWQSHFRLNNRNLCTLAIVKLYGMERWNDKCFCLSVKACVLAFTKFFRPNIYIYIYESVDDGTKCGNISRKYAYCANLPYDSIDTYTNTRTLSQYTGNEKQSETIQIIFVEQFSKWIMLDLWAMTMRYVLELF